LGLTRRNNNIHDKKYIDLIYQELKFVTWKTDLPFLVDMLEYLNNLHVRDLLANEFFTATQAFKKVFLFSKQRSK